MHHVLHTNMTVFNTDNNPKCFLSIIRVISECDTEDWSNEIQE